MAEKICELQKRIAGRTKELPAKGDQFPSFQV
jgi:hypothetical protein